MMGSVRIACMALATLCAVVLTTDEAAAAKGRLSSDQFLPLDPFIVPMMPEGEARRQFTLVVALELKDEGKRDMVKARLAVIRSRVYDMLFRLIAYRTQEPLIPATALLKKKVFDIAIGAVGTDAIESIVVQQVYQGRSP